MTDHTWECWDFEIIKGQYVRMFIRHPNGKLEPFVWCYRCQIRSKA